MTLLNKLCLEGADLAVKPNIWLQSVCVWWWWWCWGGGELTNPYFLTKSFLRSTDLSEGRWFQEARQQQRPLSRVGAAVCSQQYLISPWGKSGRLDVGVAGEARDLGCFRSGYGQAVNRFCQIMAASY